MLLNLSNHPSSSWSAEQISAAQDYGDIVDMPFPNIDPYATIDEINLLAEKYLVDIRKIDPMAIHLMGELTFTFCLVQHLQRMGYLCLASTSERLVEEKDGKKIITFNFVQFRSYK
jgi:hypothetical protein